MVNRRTWAAVTAANALNPYRVPGQRGAYFVTEDSVGRIIGELEIPNYNRKVIHMHLFLPSFPPRVRMEIGNLYNEIVRNRLTRTGIGTLEPLGGLYTLHVAVLQANIAGVGHEAVALIAEEILRGLYGCTILGELKLDFSDLASSHTHTKMGLPGCKAFWIINTYVPTVHTLSIDLTGNELGDDGVRLLSIGSIMAMVHLRKLYLGLGNNSITDIGNLNRLESGLRAVKTLEDLHIDLQDNSIDDFGSFYLSKFRLHKNLHTLTLDCANNNIGCLGAKSLTNLIVYATDHRFGHLYLNLDRNRIGSEGVSAMAAAVATTPITDIEVHMHGNPGSSV